MFIARAKLNRRRRETVRLLEDPSKMHAAVQSCFGVDDSGRVLWRVDEGKHVDELYVVALEQPDLTHIIEECGWPQAHPFESKDYSVLLDRLGDGQRLMFRLTGNPAHKVADHKNRLAHVTVAQQESWAEHQLGLAGLDVEMVRSIKNDKLRFNKGDAGHRVSLSRTVFEGSASVREVDALRNGLTAGLGPGKAYGCGLLTVSMAE